MCRLFVNILLLCCMLLNSTKGRLNTYVSITDLEQQEFAHGASTLAFVFDTTGSMYGDLQQVIEGASRILNTILDRREKPIYNYVLVPFHDPEIGPVMETADPVEFQRQLRNLYVHGGGDCPEMSIGAIKMALDASLRNSFIYVFTDARSKDFYRLQEVLALIQRKESQVVFVMTGDCGNQSHPGYQAYEQIAATSSGQIFQLTKTDVEQVLNFVQLSLEARKVNLLATDRESPERSIIQLVVDPTLREFTVSLSGDNPQINLYDPYGNKKETSTGVNTLLNLKNVQIVNIKDPVPGPWHVQVSSDSSHSLRATGLSGVDFVHGFSREPTPNFHETHHRPLKGAPTYLIINRTEIEDEATLSNVQLLDLSGNILEQVHLTAVTGHEGLYNATPFVPPDDFFYLKISGIDENGFPFQRISSTAISAQLPDAPEVIMDSRKDAYYRQPVTLTCQIQSLVPFKAAWYRGDRTILPLSREYHFEQSNEIKYNILAALGDHEDWYWCNASNIAGQTAMKSFLDVKNPPPIIWKHENVSTIIGRNVSLDCLIHSAVTFNASWSKFSAAFRKPHFSSALIENDPRFKNFGNGSLSLQNVSSNDEGWFKCSANNEGGSSHEKILLQIMEPPSIMVIPERVNFKREATIEIHCQADGNPEPSVIWKLRNHAIESTGRVRVEDKKLIIVDAIPEDEADYLCLAENSVGQVEFFAHLKYVEAPQIFNQDFNILTNRGGSVSLPCKTTGIPSPTIQWLKNSQEIQPLSYLLLEKDGTLKIIGVQDSDAGEFICRASNEAGIDEAFITLEVGYPPVFRQTQDTIEINIKENGTIICDVDGKPEPEIRWSRRNGELIDWQRHFMSPDNNLHITNSTLSDEDLYVCHAQNNFGILEEETLLIITGIEKPMLVPLPPATTFVIGEKAELQCLVISGNPSPSIKWMYNRQRIASVTTKISNDTIRLEKVQENHAGNYTCFAENIGGHANQTTFVTVHGPPKLLEGTSTEVTIQKGNYLELTCTAYGYPLPQITWHKNDKAINFENSRFKIYNNGSLEIIDINTSDSGYYTCLATNSFGVRKTSVLVHVEEPAVIINITSDIWVQEGDDVTLECETIGNPEPIVQWFYDNLMASGTKVHFKASILKSGTFTCMASNYLGQDIKTVELLVTVPPNIVGIHKQPEILLRGDEVSLTCEVIGFPQPKITWELNGQRLPQSSANTSLQLATYGLPAENDITCTATNSAGSVIEVLLLPIYEKPLIQHTSDNTISVTENQTVLLPCSAQGSPKPIITWKFNETKLEFTDELIILPNNSLLLNNVKRNNAGIYLCLARNKVGNDSFEFAVDVYVPPQFMSLTEPLVLLENSPLSITCNFVGFPSPTLTWLKDGYHYEFQGSSINGASYFIEQTVLADAGTYTCIATNIAGTARTDIFVTILVPPKIDGSNHEYLDIHSGQDISLHCLSIGVPSPKITWQHNGIPIPISKERWEIDSTRKMLTLKSVTMEDLGEFTCLSSNDAGNATKTFVLDVYYSPKIKERSHLATLNAKEGEALLLECTVEGHPKPLVSWLKNEQPLTPWDSATILETNGTSHMSIDVLTVDDEGKYSCVAANKIGIDQKGFIVNVLVPPHMDYHPGTTVEAFIDRPFTLTCPFLGKPLPMISWLKDGQPASISVNTPYVISESGTKFQIMKASDDDGGLYMCMAENDVGEIVLEFNVSVLVPPKLKNLEREVVKVKLNDTLQLSCEIQGNIFPNIIWMKNNQNINDRRMQLENYSQVLTLKNIQDKDAGEYLCLATNIVGSVQKHFFVNVIVPPYLETSSTLFHQVRQNFPVTLECTITGSPSPLIYWSNNGDIISNAENVYISHDLKMLKILKAKLQDTGHYFCNATNEGGDLQIDFYVQVIVPPKILGHLRLKNRILEGNNTRLICEVEGIPQPVIIWLKDGEILFNQTNSRIISLNDDQELIIRSVQSTDSGVYVCIAANDAGSAEKNFIVDVLVAPVINNDMTDNVVEVLENRPLFLPCQVTGVPTPSVKWMKGGVLLPQSRNFNILLSAGTNVLKLRQARFQDSDIYKCIAVNEVGQVEQSFNVTVLVPPVIHNNQYYKQFNGITQVAGKLNETVNMQCVVTGHPQPKVIWLHNGQLVNQKEQHFNKQNNSYTLVLDDIQTFSSGQYICIAVNAAGTAEKEFELDVLVPPQISFEIENKFSNDVLINRPVSMTCPIYGNPKPTIRWFKDAKYLNATDSKPVFRLLLDGSRLQILQSKPEDAGNYTCEAKNVVGALNLTMKLFVQVPPKITKSLHKQNVLVNETVTLGCIVTGNPFPVITWLKDSQILDQDNLVALDIELMKREQLLKINKANLWHDGKFSCIATNEVGVDEHEITLYVNIPPVIDAILHNRRHSVLVSRNAIIECLVTAKPPAVLKWYKEDNLINPYENPLLQILNSGAKLQIIRSREHDSGKYSCLATNIAGEDKASFYVDVLVPPSIDHDFHEENNIRVLEGDTLEIDCYVNGNPFPVVTWLKDGNILTVGNDDRIQLLFDNQLLHFSVTRFQDKGVYTCTATSMIGTAEKQVELNVLVPPRVSPVTDPNPVTLLHDPVMFECHADGFPQPVMTWLKNGNPVHMLSDPNIQILNDGEQMQIQRSRLTDAGYYSCLAVNIAGDDEFEFALQIQVPPRIDRSNIIPAPIFIENEVAVLECPVSGIPIPSIMWLKEEKPLFPRADNRIQIFADGEKLRISNAHDDDAGLYTCIASNEVGTDKMIFDLQVLSPPQMNDGDRSLHVREGDIIALSCPLELLLLPLITWKRDGEVLSDLSTDNVVLSPNNADIKIMGARLSDSGTYTCIASNQAGQSMVNFHVEVLVPPKIQKLSPGIVKVIEGQTISLPCLLIEENPLPEITWLKNKNPILGFDYSKWTSGNDIMPVANLEPQTANEDDDAESPQRGDVALLDEYEEFVNPNTSKVTISEAWKYKGQAAIANEITFPHEDPQIPFEENEWETERVKIFDGGSLLMIRNATPSDSGDYSCVATNDIGTDQRHVTVIVMEIPVINLDVIDHLIKIAIDEKLTLKCPASGVPNPRIIWYKDSHPLSLNSVIQVSANGELTIMKAKLADAGLYSCIAINEAGTDKANITVMVLVPPMIHTLRTTKRPFAVLNESFELECSASGIPQPAISWYKDGIFLSTNQVHLSNKLKISEAFFDDVGVYTCMALNDVGNTTENITLNVLVPPNIHGIAPSKTVNAILYTPLFLVCPLKGIPPPEISWTKYQRRILPNEKFQFIKNKSTLWISSVQQSDAADYKCTALNEAGSFDFLYQVNVLVPPYYSESSVDVVVTAHNSVYLDCTPSGNPKPQITWSRTDNANVTLDNVDDTEGYIARASMNHNGTYVCLAENSAGQAVKYINLIVHVPPTIVNKLDEEVNALAQETIILECQADGIPTPAMTWYKDGQLLIGDGLTNFRVIIKNKDLHISSSQVGDSGIYMCLATNAVGIASKEYKLNVMVAPSFEDIEEEVVTLVGERTLISCKASGVPEPKINWTKLNTSLLWSKKRMINPGILVLQQTQLEDAGVYICTATNLAGIARKSVNLTVHMSPTPSSFDENIQVLRDSPVSLNCKMKGIPKPRIFWKRENNFIQQSTAYNLNNTGTLFIPSVLPEMAGDYTCIGENEVGLSEVHKNLIVLDPPRIVSLITNYTVTTSGHLSIPCKAEGYPIPSIEWRRAEENVLEIDHRYSVSDEGALLISSVVREDAGIFHCIAINKAGKAVKQFRVLVLVPPSIKVPQSTKFVVPTRNSTILPCHSQGNPLPSISWMHNLEILDNLMGNKEILSSGDLLIQQATATDSGIYTCIASNTAGQTELSFVLEIFTSPILTYVPSAIDIGVNEQLSLVCEAQGNPSPLIKWIYNGSVLNVTNATGSVKFKIEKSKATDGGIYTCEAENLVGKQQASISVIIKVPPSIVEKPQRVVVHEQEQAILPCIVKGNPKPRVIWMKNNRRLNGELNHENVINNSLIIIAATVNDAGNYKCIAMNDAGVTEKVIELIVSMRPQVSIQPELITATLGSVVSIHCYVHATPAAFTQWKFGNKVLISENHITIFPNNTLRIAAVEISDAGHYTCLAENKLGPSFAEAVLKVKVSGEFSLWGDWEACSVSCGLGKQKRYRFCNSPAPQNGGLQCKGFNDEERICAPKECPVNGGWSEWNKWLPCSTSCGNGTQLRTRECNNPVPMNGGITCDGNNTEKSDCFMMDCPVHGKWSSWSAWSDCSHTCGEGQQIRQRACDNPAPNFHGKDCDGSPIEIKGCKQKECIIVGEWSSWTAWTSCSHSCGGGTSIRERQCLFPSSNTDGEYCQGLSQQISECNNDFCPVHGNWSPWSLWGECSALCGGGHRKRSRMCNNPSPNYGGKTCTGLFQTTEPCNMHHCPVHGQWSLWSDWSYCSVTCDTGNRKRVRTCSNPSPKYGGMKCHGANERTEACILRDCPGFPRYAVGNLIGYVNENDIDLSTISVNISYHGNKSNVHVTGMLNNMTPKLATWLKPLTSIFSPIYWSFAHELDNAVNGYSLTKGFFQRDSEVMFPSGEVLKMTHIARGVSSNNTFLIDLVLTGTVPEFFDDITFDDYTEDYIQTGSGSIYARSTRTIQTNGYVYPYAWNHSLIYDESEGTMPFLVEKLHTQNIGVEYNDQKQTLNFVMTASISKGDLKGTCPVGFVLDDLGPYCSDINECVSLHSCSHGCLNYPGSYACYCPRGHSLGPDGSTCFDIDECKFGLAKCNPGHDCQNTIGSYSCILSCDIGFEMNEVRNLCIDIDECKEIPQACDQLCINGIGSYHCECSMGFQKIGKGNCIDIDECSLFPSACSHSCENNPGSYSCVCPPGFAVSNIHECVDIDECTTDLHQCPPNSECENIVGGYQCRQRCPSGYTRADNGSCIDIDECQAGNAKCNSNQICQNTVGSYKCFCPPGYYFVAPNEPCIDVDECALKHCQHDCENTVGSFHCLCPSGYRLANNEKNCLDIDECFEFNIHCRSDETCFNTRGSFQCIYTPCPSDYYRNLDTGHCVLPCDESDVPCPPNVKYQEILMYKMVAVPSGIRAKQELVHLIAYDQEGHQLPYTMFNIEENKGSIQFQIKPDGGKGILYPLRDLAPGHEYFLKINAVSYDSYLRTIQYTTKFSIVVAVSMYPY